MELLKLNKKNLREIHGITKNSNAIVTIQYINNELKCTTEQKCVIGRENFNLIVNNISILGTFVFIDNYNLPIFKTLKF